MNPLYFLWKVTWSSTLFPAGSCLDLFYWKRERKKKKKGGNFWFHMWLPPLFVISSTGPKHLPPVEASTCWILNPLLNFRGFAQRGGKCQHVWGCSRWRGLCDSVILSLGQPWTASSSSSPRSAPASPAVTCSSGGTEGAASLEEHLCCKQKFAQFREGADFCLESVKWGPDLGSEWFHGGFFAVVLHIQARNDFSLQSAELFSLPSGRRHKQSLRAAAVPWLTSQLK